MAKKAEPQAGGETAEGRGASAKAKATQDQNLEQTNSKSKSENEQNAEATVSSPSVQTPTAVQNVKLNGLFLFKDGMTTVFNASGEAVACTVLRYEPWIVSQIKTQDRDGYRALQLACRPKRKTTSNKALSGHCSAAGFQNGAGFLREFRGEFPEEVRVGFRLDIQSLQKGDMVKATGRSKGRGFAGVVKRHHFAGGPAAHGSKFHRIPGSVGNRTWPGRVMPGKRFPGHMGDENVTVSGLEVIDVLVDENVVLLKGAVPGSRNGLVKLTKMGNSQE